MSTPEKVGGQNKGRPLHFTKWGAVPLSTHWSTPMTATSNALLRQRRSTMLHTYIHAY